MSPGYLLDATSQLLCAHGGKAQPAAPAARVRVSGQPVVIQSTAYAVAGCALTGTPNPPCATAQFVSAATRVTSMNQPVLLQDSQSQCAPTGTPLSVLVTQIRVKGT
ncbi:hypothetical protein RZS28_03840 [Methylocapsa polymorpha]|uniref:DUF4280 domain-containing protein n=1 Tax=Methylocapsa polymorpha TaxID=3080828 RepID=A0ABZ0HUG9_9HYPH|nr:hypothetical protein RZS28_03840 [Methylocapsa sp. RX1]